MARPVNLDTTYHLTGGAGRKGRFEICLMWYAPKSWTMSCCWIAFKNRWWFVPPFTLVTLTQKGVPMTVFVRP